MIDLNPSRNLAAESPHAATKTKLPIFLGLLLLAAPAAVQAQYAYSTNADGSIYSYTTNTDGSINIAGYSGPPWAVTIPADINNLLVTSVGEKAFIDCFGLTSVTIPDSVTSIGVGAFEFCAGLTSITIPSSVTNIGAGAFEACSSLAAITVDPNNSFYSDVDGVLFNQSQSTLIEYPPGLAGSYRIPGSVTSIGEAAFAATGLAGVTIPGSVASIGPDAFGDCYGLISVTIPGSVTNIGDNAFFGCSSLTSITIPGSVASIGAEAFYECSTLRSVTLSNGLSTIGFQAFYQCSQLTSVTIPGSVASIGEEAFAGCTSLTNVTMADGIASIGDYAFDACSSLINVTIPGSVTNIGTDAFYECSRLTSVYFTGNAPAADGGLFSGSVTAYYLPGTTGWSSPFAGILAEEVQTPYSFTINADTTITITGYTALAGTVAIPATLIGLPVSSIGPEAFLSNTSLTGVTIPASVTTIGSGAFEGCAGLSRVTILGNIASLAEDMFKGCTSLTSLYFAGNAPVADLTVFAGDNNVTGYYLAGATGWSSPFAGIPVEDVEIPYGFTINAGQTVTINDYTGPGGAVALPAAILGLPVAIIGPDAFLNNTNLTSVTIPGSVTNIGEAAFEGCTKLTGVTIPASVTNIGNYAFQWCINLTGVTIPASVTNIGNYAFQWCTNLTGVTIPASVTFIGLGAFEFCPNLTSVYFKGNAPGLIRQGIGLAGTAYYLPGTTGWNSTYSGVPAVLWNPLIQVGGANFGVQNNQFGFNITGTNNFTVVVAACTNLAGAVWVPLTTNTLVNGSFHFSDPQWTNYSHRYYSLQMP